MTTTRPRPSRLVRTSMAIALGFSLVVVLASLVSHPTGAAPTDEGAASASVARVESEVRAFLQRYTKAIESEDADAIRSLYVPDDRFAWYTDGAIAYASPDDVVAGRLAYRGVRFATTYSRMRIVPLGSKLASARAGFRTRLEIPGQDDHEYGGVVTWLLERDVEAGWRVLLGHTSTPGGPPASDERR